MNTYQQTVRFMAEEYDSFASVPDTARRAAIAQRWKDESWGWDAWTPVVDEDLEYIGTPVVKGDWDKLGVSLSSASAIEAVQKAYLNMHDDDLFLRYGMVAARVMCSRINAHFMDRLEADFVDEKAALLDQSRPWWNQQRWRDLVADNRDRKEGLK